MNRLTVTLLSVLLAGGACRQAPASTTTTSMPGDALAPVGTSGVAPSPAQPLVVADAPVPAPVVTSTRTTRQRVVRTEPRRRHRSWKKSAVVIGGSSAAGAGIGALVGGKKGALIGAAAGAGAGTVYEVKKRKKRR